MDYHYDKRGNITQIDKNGNLAATYTYDATNMMTAALTPDNGTAEYVYNGFKDRVRKLENFQNTHISSTDTITPDPAEEVRYILDMTLPYNNLLMIQGTHNQSFTWGNSLLSGNNLDTSPNSQLSNESNFYYLQDHLGSPIRILGENDNDSIMAYDELGVMSVAPDSYHDFHNPFGFTGYQSDNISGLYYAQARFYNSLTGRFSAEDPARDQLNWYGYGNANPMSYVDPTGLFASSVDHLPSFDDGSSNTSAAVCSTCRQRPCICSRPSAQQRPAANPQPQPNVPSAPAPVCHVCRVNPCTCGTMNNTHHAANIPPPSVPHIPTPICPLCGVNPCTCGAMNNIHHAANVPPPRIPTPMCHVCRQSPCTCGTMDNMHHAANVPIQVNQQDAPQVRELAPVMQMTNVGDKVGGMPDFITNVFNVGIPFSNWSTGMMLMPSSTALYGLNRTIASATYNTDQQRVFERRFSSYRGQVVVTTINTRGTSAISLGPVMILGGGIEYNPQGINLLMHENGHFREYQELGLFMYLLGIGLPSIVNYIRDQEPGFFYFNQPWERHADFLGGVERERHTEEALALSILYFQHLQSIGGIRGDTGWFRFLTRDLWDFMNHDFSALDCDD